MKNLILCVLSLVLSVSLSARELDSLLRVLDNLVRNKEYYTDIRMSRIDSLKARLAVSGDIDEKIGLCNAINLQYIVFQTDSALTYAKQMLQYAKIGGNRSKIVEATINVSRVLNVIGQYKEALDLLDEVSDNVPEREKAQMAYCRLSIYNSLREFSLDGTLKNKYTAMAEIYRDSVLNHYRLSPRNRLFVRAEELILKGQYTRAGEELAEAYNGMSPHERDAGIVAYSLGVVYRELGDPETSAIYFCKSAIADLYSGVKQHTSLQIMSEIMYGRRDIDRAYRYAKSAMEDYIYCNARLRTLETSNIFMLIDHSYQEKQHQASTNLKILLSIISLLLIILLSTLWYLRRVNRRLSEARRHYARANAKISSTSLKLRDSNMIKEEYIGLYMELCSNYLDMMNSIRNKVNKSIRRGTDSRTMLEELEKMMNIEGQVKDFYHTFDATILHLFPNFPQKLDELLQPEARGVYSKTEDGLSPECRIFALIRLGITDSAKIAQFLRYSLSTIYNYRTKLRNKSLGPREEFEKKVMRIDRGAIYDVPPKSWTV
ncbi:MAG: DUF6377 domain-containing protein [Candidatus Cryptobacteroides sp.]